MTADDFEANDYVNLFDYFQGTTHVKPKLVQPEDIVLGVNDLHYDYEDSRVMVLTAQNQLVARINFDQNADYRVMSVELFDPFNNLYRVDFYDVRGFKSLEQWYTPDNKIGTEVWLDLDGRPVIETFNRFDVSKTLMKTGWRLLGDRQEAHVFETIDELTQYWFNALNHEYLNQETANIFVLDRSHVGDWQVLNLEAPAYSVLHLHNSHAGDAQEPIQSVLNNFYEYPLFNLNQYDAVVSATHKQTHDVQVRFEPTTKLFTIPVGIVSNEQLAEKRVPMADRTFGKVIATARVANEKRLNHLAQAVAEAHKQVPEISLDIYGYADGTNDFQARRDVETVIKDYDASDYIKLHDYTQDVPAIQKDAQLYGLTSIMEGFNLAIMEASSRGDVGVTYDVNYGPNEIIVDGENGAVVPFGDSQAVAEKLVDYLTHPKELQAASDKAYELAQRYSSDNVWQAWQALLDDAKTTWPGKLSRYQPRTTAMRI
jgi:poly(glycerol-phosphate) alpha-glucosyltransferase